MPCDTPPPPSPVDDVINDGNDEEPDDLVYDFIDDIDELLIYDDMPEDNAIITFDAHKESVFCCNFDRTGQFIVTGGQDDKAFVWSVLNKSIKFECTGHLDSVIAANFSSDSKYVATADMNGFVQVWDVDTGERVWDFETSEITWSGWLRGTNNLIAGSSDGNCWNWSIPDGTANVLPNASASCCAGSISHNDEKLATGYSDGSLKFWDIANNSLLTTLKGSLGHSGAITTVKFSVDDSLILTGSEDGTAKVIKASDFKMLWTVDGCDETTQHEHETVSVEDVGICHTLPYIVTGTNCGMLCIWDLNSKTKRAQVELNSSIVKIICDEFVSIVYAAVGDGTLHAYDTRTGTALKYWHGHKAAILDLAISSDRSLFLTASDDHTCKIFERGIM